MKRFFLVVLCLMFIPVWVFSFEVGDIVKESGRGKYEIIRIDISQDIKGNLETLIILKDLKTNKEVKGMSYDPRCLEYDYPSMIEKLQKENKLLKEQLDGFMQTGKSNRYKECSEKVLDDMEKSVEPSIYLNDKNEEVEVMEKRKDKEGYAWFKIKYKNFDKYYWKKEVELKLIELKK